MAAAFETPGLGTLGPVTDDLQLVVARIGRPHGLKGEVALELRTDDPDARLAVGERLATNPPEAGPLTVASARENQGRWYVKFDEAADRTAVEALRGVELLTAAAASSGEDDAWYRHELVGLSVELADGTVVGKVTGLEHRPAQDALVIRENGAWAGAETLIPLVAEIVPLVDVSGGRVVIDPPGGLLARDAAQLDVDPPKPSDFQSAEDA